MPVLSVWKTVKPIDNLDPPYLTEYVGITKSYTSINHTEEENFLRDFLGDDYDILIASEVPTLEEILDDLKDPVVTIQ